eukprot:2018771-Pleurochrysis_carterae.AAC.1
MAEREERWQDLQARTDAMEARTRPRNSLSAKIDNSSESMRSANAKAFAHREAQGMAVPLLTIMKATS